MFKTKSLRLSGQAPCDFFRTFSNGSRPQVTHTDSEGTEQAFLCLPIEQVRPPQSKHVTAHSFGLVATDYEELHQGVSTFVRKCDAKLRKENSVASTLTVWLFKAPSKKYCGTEPSRFANLHKIPSESSAPPSSVDRDFKGKLQVQKTWFIVGEIVSTGTTSQQRKAKSGIA